MNDEDSDFTFCCQRSILHKSQIFIDWIFVTTSVCKMLLIYRVISFIVSVNFNVGSLASFSFILSKNVLVIVFSHRRQKKKTTEFSESSWCNYWIINRNQLILLFFLTFFLFTSVWKSTILLIVIEFDRQFLFELMKWNTCPHYFNSVADFINNIKIKV